MSVWALIPVKARSACKTRLAARLTPQQRVALVRVMLAQVIEVLRAVAAIDRIALVSPERDEVADDILLLPDPSGNLNGCLQRALFDITVQGATAAVIVSADLPLLAAREVSTLIEAMGSGHIALAPDRLSQGTNAIGVTLPTRWQLQLGTDSFRLHCAQATRLGLRVNRVDAPGLAFDLDQPSDLSALNRQLALRRPASTQVRVCGQPERVSARASQVACGVPEERQTSLRSTRQ